VSASPEVTGVARAIEEATEAIRKLREENEQLRRDARQEIINELREAAGIDGHFGFSPYLAGAADYLEAKQ
jgi:hypothetical protein